jgi:hypothetical protein
MLNPSASIAIDKIRVSDTSNIGNDDDRMNIVLLDTSLRSPPTIRVCVNTVVIL